ncbi:MAG: response regulator [Pseudanabaena sp. ELA607]|jgi:twitching motility two-component system response regulator PilH
MTKILVVEDTPSQQELITGILRESGYEVSLANNGQEALSQLEQVKPDVIITDLVMPGMSGLELCRNLKRNPNTKDLPVLACTSKNQELDKLWGMKQGIDVYITKPFTKEDLLKALRSVVPISK